MKDWTLTVMDLILSLQVEQTVMTLILQYTPELSILQGME
jgi:hypothetical protein